MTQTPPLSTLFPYTTLFRSAEHEIREGRQILAGEHVLEDVLELGHHPDHEDGEDDDGDEDDGAGIEHCGDDLAFDLLRFLHELDRKSTRLNSSHRCISYAVF